MREPIFELRGAWRGLRSDRLYSAAVVGTLTLTLGASIAVFSIVNGVLLRPLDYPEPQALVSIREILPGISHRYPTLPVTMRHFEVWRDRAVSYTAMAATDWRTSTLTGRGEAAQVVVLRASGTLFDVLQIQPALGRALNRDDENRAHPPVAVIGDQVWRERFNGDPNIVGQSITLNGTQHTIVGVLARGSRLPRMETLSETGSVTTDIAAIVPFRIDIQNFDWMGMFNYGVIARLKPGVTLQQARAEMDVLQATVSEIARRETRAPADVGGWIRPVDDTIVGPVRRGLLLLLGAIGALLLIACANLANLALTRTLDRLRDAAVRGALGASRWRLVRTVLVEQLLLASSGAVLGVGFAALALRLFVTTAPISLPRAQEVSIDARVLGFSAVIAVLSALAVAMLPAWRLGRGDLEAVLRSGGRTSDAGAQRVRKTLLMAQVALSVMLLAVGGLFVSSLTRLLRVDTGFSAEGAMTVELAPGSRKYPGIAERAALYDRIFDRVRELPGVTAVAWTSALPLTGETWVDRVVRRDSPTPNHAASNANYRFVSPEYFRAVGMPLIQGRSFETHERDDAVTPAVISLRTARTLWPGEEVLGREFARSDPAQRFLIVGVVGDGRVTALDSDAPLMVYVPYWFNNEGKSVLVVRAQGDPSAVLPAIRQIVRDVDPDVAVAKIAPLDDLIDDAVETRRYQASLFGAFGASALLLAILGVYATTAHGVSRRRRELNIRVALGAQSSQVFAMILRQSISPVAIGLAAGLAGALGAGGLVASLLYEVRPRDPLVLALVIAVVGLIATASAAVATLGGLRIDPASALRDE
jgi:predicted permease